MCSVNRIYKNKDKLSLLFVVPEGGPVLVGMLDIKVTGNVSVNHNTIKPRGQVREMGE